MLSVHGKVASYDRTRTPKTLNNKANWQTTKKRNVKKRKVARSAKAKVAQCLFLLNLRF